MGSDDSNVDQTDKLFKFRYMIDNVRRSFKEHYVPHEHILVDEAMIPFKGRLSFKQYMKDKPVKFGIKMWVLADSVTAYCHNFDIYVGRFTQGVQVHTRSEQVHTRSEQVHTRSEQVHTRSEQVLWLEWPGGDNTDTPSAR